MCVKGHLSEQGGTISLDGAPNEAVVFKVVNFLNTAFDRQILDTLLPCKSENMHTCVKDVSMISHGQ